MCCFGNDILSDQYEADDEERLTRLEHDCRQRAPMVWGVATTLFAISTTVGTTGVGTSSKEATVATCLMPVAGVAVELAVRAVKSCRTKDKCDITLPASGLASGIGISGGLLAGAAGACAGSAVTVAVIGSVATALAVFGLYRCCRPPSPPMLATTQDSLLRRPVV